MLLPLTTLDAGPQGVAMCSAFVFSLPRTWRSAEDGQDLLRRLEEAASRVVRRWPLLAGIPEMGSDGLWLVNVPDDVDAIGRQRPLYTFTTATLSQTYQTAANLARPPTPFFATPSGILFNPTRNLFIHPSRPASMAEHAAQQRPLLDIHVTVLSDAVAVGISVPHGVFDGTGIGQVLSALTSELRGEDWQVPSAFEHNPFIDALEDLAKDEKVEERAKAEKQVFPSLWESWKPFTPIGLKKFLWSAKWENWWNRSEAKWLFLKQDLVDSMVAKTKAEVKQETGGREYVSTGDILAAWLLKAAHADESSSSDTLSAASLYSARPLLSPRSSFARAISLYPHCATIPYTLFPLSPSHPFSLSTLSQTPLSSFSLLIRRSLPQHRNLPVLQAMWRKMSTSPPLLPVRDWPKPVAFFLRLYGFFTGHGWDRTPHTHRWLLSNQMSLGMSEFSLPDREGKDLPLLAYHLLGEGAFEMDAVLPFQQTPAGVTVSGTMRRKRWQSLEKALRGLQRELGAA
ncbi:hypothetical protein JCM11641_003193 [Rhodosporidiobolus odoratus]